MFSIFGITKKTEKLLLIALLIGLSGCKSKKIEKNKLALASDSSVAMPLGGKEVADGFFSDDISEFALSDEAGSDELSEKNTVLVWDDALAESTNTFKPVLFQFDKSEITEPSQMAAIDIDIVELKKALAQAEESGESVAVAVNGHACHSAGDREYNRAISEKRAVAVADILKANGVDSDLIKIVGLGQDYPVIIDGKKVTGSREEQAPNRRVELRVMYA